MKKNIFIASLLVIGLMAQSCKTTEGFTLAQGTAPTVYLPDDFSKPVEYSKDGKIVTSDNNYYSYMLARDKATGLNVPFGIDYKNRNVAVNRLGTAACFAGSGVAMVGLLIEVIASSVEDEDMVTSGLGVALSGIGLACAALPAPLRGSQLAYKYRYKYLPTQSVYEGKLFNTLQHPCPPKSQVAAAPAKIAQPAVNSGSAAKRTFKKDAAPAVEGTYTGTGKLLKDGNIVETYSSVQVVITPDALNTVKVRVLESGEDFFGGESVYEVASQANGSFLLTLKEMPEATILIDSNGSAHYVHPNVIIDAEKYTLDAKTTKK